jgi:DNA polymerase-3 subunit gamma/tau
LPCSKEDKAETPKDSVVKEPISMIEDVEVGGNDSSCVSNCTDDEALKEVNRDDILKEPIVAKAIEMFEAKKVIVQSKI